MNSVSGDMESVKIGGKGEDAIRFSALIVANGKTAADKQATRTLRARFNLR